MIDFLAELVAGFVQHFVIEPLFYHRYWWVSLLLLIMVVGLVVLCCSNTP